MGSYNGLSTGEKRAQSDNGGYAAVLQDIWKASWLQEGHLKRPEMLVELTCGTGWRLALRHQAGTLSAARV